MSTSRSWSARSPMRSSILRMNPAEIGLFGVKLPRNARVGRFGLTPANSPSGRTGNRTSQLGAAVKSGGSLPKDRSQNGLRQSNRRSHNSAPPESTQNKRPTPIAQPNPLRRRATLALGNRCLPHSADPCSTHAVPSPRITHPTALDFVICSPKSRSAAGTSRNRLGLTPAARLWVAVISQLIDYKWLMGLFGQNSVAATTHNSAQFRLMVQAWRERSASTLPPRHNRPRAPVSRSVLFEIGHSPRA